MAVVIRKPLSALVKINLIKHFFCPFLGIFVSDGSISLIPLPPLSARVSICLTTPPPLSAYVSIFQPPPAPPLAVDIICEQPLMYILVVVFVVLVVVLVLKMVVLAQV